MPPHCDSLDGPVVKAATDALEAREVDLVLPFVPAEDGQEVREAFEQALRVAPLAPGPLGLQLEPTGAYSVAAVLLGTQRRLSAVGDL